MLYTIEIIKVTVNFELQMKFIYPLLLFNIYFDTQSVNQLANTNHVSTFIA
jgi:hypothetical protein